MLLREAAYSDDWLAAHVPLGRWGRRARWPPPSRSSRATTAATSSVRCSRPTAGPSSERGRAEANPVFGLERRGFDHIPEGERTMTLRETAYFWVGTNANLFFVSVGVDRARARAERVAGARRRRARHAAVRGRRGWRRSRACAPGLPTMTFTRAVFGPRGNLPHVAARVGGVGGLRGDQLHLRRLRAARADAAALGWEHPGAPARSCATRGRARGVGAHRRSSVTPRWSTCSGSSPSRSRSCCCWCSRTRVGDVEWSAPARSES